MQRRGFTLLETVLAITLLAMATTLAAALWANVRGAHEDGVGQAALMRLTRVQTLLREQWAARRIVVAEADAGSKARGLLFKGDRLEFVTAKSVLFPDWPIVRVVWIVEGVSAVRNGEGESATYRLLYKETRLAEFEANGGDSSIRFPDGRTVEELVLLEACSSLHWKWRTASDTPVVSEEASLEKAKVQPVVMQGAGDDGWHEMIRTGVVATSREERLAEETQRDFQMFRLVGTHAPSAQEFAWTLLVAEALR